MSKDAARAEKTSRFRSKGTTSYLPMVTSKVCEFQTPVLQSGTFKMSPLYAMPCSNTKQFTSTVVGGFAEATAIFPTPWIDFNFVSGWKPMLAARDHVHPGDASTTTACTCITGSEGTGYYIGGESITTILRKPVEIAPVTRASIPSTATTDSHTTAAPSMALRDIAEARKEKKCKWTSVGMHPKSKSTYEVPCQASSIYKSMGWPNPITYWGTDQGTSLFPVVTTTIDLNPSLVPTRAPLVLRAHDVNCETKECSWNFTLGPEISRAGEVPCSMASHWSSQGVPNPANLLTEPALASLMTSEIPSDLPIASESAEDFGEDARLAAPTRARDTTLRRDDYLEADTSTTALAALSARNAQVTEAAAGAAASTTTGAAQPTLIDPARDGDADGVDDEPNVLDLIIAIPSMIGFVVLLIIARKYCITKSHEDMAYAADISEKEVIGSGQPIQNHSSFPCGPNAFGGAMTA